MAHLGSPVHGLGVLWGDTPRKKEQMKMMKCIHTLHKGEDGSTGIDRASFAAQCYYKQRKNK